jgi:hypothetical protein
MVIKYIQILCSLLILASLWWLTDTKMIRILMIPTSGKGGVEWYALEWWIGAVIAGFLIVDILLNLILIALERKLKRLKQGDSA